MSCGKESSLSNEMLNISYPELSDKCDITRELMKTFNEAKEDEKDKRLRVIKDVLNAIGNDAWLEPPLHILYGKNTSLGNTVYFNFNCVILDAYPVTIGDFVFFGPAVQIHTEAHPSNPIQRKLECRTFGRPVEIGSDVWLGGRVIVCPGVKVGQGSVVGAGSIVTNDIPPNSLAVGNPCRVIKTITDKNYPKWTSTFVGSEKEKMLQGELYNSLDPQLCKERDHARILMKLFNSGDDKEKRMEIIKELFAETGKDTQVEPPFYCDYGYNITLGKNVRMYSSCVILDVCPVTIGDNVVLRESVHLYPGTHTLRSDERRAGLEYGKPIHIGSDVLVGGGAIICPGIKIGNGSIIGAGSVVTKDIPPHVLAAGNPCRVIEVLDKS